MKCCTFVKKKKWIVIVLPEVVVVVVVVGPLKSCLTMGSARLEKKQDSDKTIFCLYVHELKQREQIKNNVYCDWGGQYEPYSLCHSLNI